MNLVIYDFEEEKWNAIKHKYPGWIVFSKKDKIYPCNGCFGCWVSSPGMCTIKDRFQKIGSYFANANEVVIYSKCTYGGFSEFIKNVLDRTVSYFLPFFELHHGIMRHKRRYPQLKTKISVHFYGDELCEVDKKIAIKYLEEVCFSYNFELKDIIFEDEIRQFVFRNPATVYHNSNDEADTILLNCSYRGENANSKKYLKILSDYLKVPYKEYDLLQYRNKQDRIVHILLQAKQIVLGIPSYSNGLPSQVISLFERVSQIGVQHHIKIYVIGNMGLYESVRFKVLFQMVQNWCNRTGFFYGGGLAIGAGEMYSAVLDKIPFGKGVTKNLAREMKDFARVVNNSNLSEDHYIRPNHFPKIIYIHFANSIWFPRAKKNGLIWRQIRNREMIAYADDEGQTST